jgi:hypothetical protein
MPRRASRIDGEAKTHLMESKQGPNEHLWQRVANRQNFFRGGLVSYIQSAPVTLEHFHKSYSDVLKVLWTTVFLDFGFRLRQGYGGQVVSAQSQGF